MATQDFDIIFILDESGSMTSFGNEALESTNNFIQEQQELYSNDTSTFTLWKFSDKPKLVINDQKLSEIKPLTEFKPNGCTALLDTIGKAISTKIAKPNNTNVVLAILTDGEENASKEYTQKMISDMIKTVEKLYNWQVFYLAANQDAITVGETIGVKAQCCSSFSSTPQGIKDVIDQTSAAIASLRISKKSK